MAAAGLPDPAVLLARARIPGLTVPSLMCPLAPPPLTPSSDEAVIGYRPWRLVLLLTPVWSCRDERDAVEYLIEMPGLGKEDVEVRFKEGILAVEGGSGNEEDGGGRRYSGQIELPPENYRIREVRAEINNGLLKIVVPKVTPEEGDDPVRITVN